LVADVGERDATVEAAGDGIVLEDRLADRL
jgi:hypothetical protein